MLRPSGSATSATTTPWTSRARTSQCIEYGAQLRPGDLQQRRNRLLRLDLTDRGRRGILAGVESTLRVKAPGKPRVTISGIFTVPLPIPNKHAVAWTRYRTQTAE